MSACTRGGACGFTCQWRERACAPARRARCSSAWRCAPLGPRAQSPQARPGTGCPCITPRVQAGRQTTAPSTVRMQCALEHSIMHWVETATRERGAGWARACAPRRPQQGRVRRPRPAGRRRRALPAVPGRPPAAPERPVAPLEPRAQQQACRAESVSLVMRSESLPD